MLLKNRLKFRYNECEREGVHMAKSNPQNKTTQLHPEFNKQQQRKVNYKKRQRKVARNRLMLMFGVFFIVIGGLAFTYHEQRQALEEKQKQSQALTQELKDQKELKKDLEVEIKQLNDDDYIAQLAREKLFLSEKGEVLFTLPKKDEKKQKNDESSN